MENRASKAEEAVESLKASVQRSKLAKEARSIAQGMLDAYARGDVVVTTDSKDPTLLHVTVKSPIAVNYVKLVVNIDDD